MRRHRYPAELEKLLPYATDIERQQIEAVIQYGGQREAARQLGVNNSNICRAIARVEKRASLQGFAPAHGLTKPAAPGFGVTGVTTLYDKDGELSLQWVMQRRDKEQIEAQLREAVEAFKEGVPRAEPTPLNQASRDGRLVNVHIVTDYHLGMKAWGKEAGEDWDLAIAEDLLVRWFSYAIERAPNASVGVLAQLGDFLHWDGLEAVTPTSRHVLDADTRFQKIVRVAIRTLRRIVQMMLEKYETVHLVMADANHDPASGVWLREMFAAFYSEEPRISVDDSADTYYCLEHGMTSLFFHHGHKRKPGNIDDVLVAKFREVFGRTKYSYCHMGHMHHDHRLETNLMTVEQHRTMAAKDAYASRGGWMAGRAAPVITYSSEYGEVGRLTVTPEMLYAEQARTA